MNDYSQIAELYDAYVRVDLDLSFFVEAASGAIAVLELMAGTGRVSAALADATPQLTCVDRSPAMLHGLRRKVPSTHVHPLCADVCALPLAPGFDVVMIPFNSFSELTDPRDQRQALSEVHRLLRPGGRFVCTLHNPAVRRASLDGVERRLTDFTMDDTAWTLTATGTLDGADHIARSVQRYVGRKGGQVVERREQIVRFALIEREAFEAMAARAGFVIESLVGDYEGSAFQASDSPFLIWTLRREEVNS